MIIGFDGSRAFLKERTGTENYSYQLLKHLAKIDIENHYLVYIRPGVYVDLKEWPSNFQFSILNFQFLWTQVGLSLQTFKDNLDLLFVPSHTLPLFRKPGLKTVTTVHDLGVEYLPKMHQLKQRLYLDFITRFQLKTATKLIAVSEATKNDLVNKIGIDSNRVVVIYEGVDRKFFKPVKDDRLRDVLRQYDLEPKRYFLFVGTIQPRKNIKRLIEAFKKCESSLKMKLVLVGSKGWLSDDIYKLPKKLGIEDRVRFLGRVEDKFLPSLYSGAIALVFPSLYEGFGLPILEAFACQCPVLTSNISSTSEVARNAAILVNPYRTEEITDAMIKVTNDLPAGRQGDILRNSLIEKGSRRVEKFGWERCARETLELFNKLKS